MNHKRTLLISFFFILFFAFSLTALASFTYTPMEKIPGFESETTGDFCVYIKALYKFGLWTIGICAMFMITIGGYMYITSAGNSASMTNAKGVIFDAIIGILLAFFAWLLLNEINPNLLKMQTICGSSSGRTTPTTTTNDPNNPTNPSTPTDPTSPYGEGKTCSAFTYGDWEPKQCTAGSTQTRTASGLPMGCTGGTPDETSRPCDSNNTCTSFTYSDWTQCTTGDKSETRRRIILDRSPDGCIGGDPLTVEQCP